MEPSERSFRDDERSIDPVQKRVAHIRPGDHWSPEILIFLVAVILILVVAIPLLIRNGGN